MKVHNKKFKRFFRKSTSFPRKRKYFVFALLLLVVVLNTTFINSLLHAHHADKHGFSPSILTINVHENEAQEKLRTANIEVVNGVPMVIWTIWIGGEKSMSQTRFESFKELESKTKVPVIMISQNNLEQWMLQRHPLHAAFKYLTHIHQSDYLRAYFWHFYGGGYMDVKPLLNDSWVKYWDIFSDSNVWLIGPQELAAADVAGNATVKANYKKLVCNGQFIGRANTSLSNTLYSRQQKLLSKKLQALKLSHEKYKKPNRCCKNPAKYEYPLCWTCVLGQLNHPAQFLYSQHVNTSMISFDRSKQYQ